jgi:PPOX class probable F420-dependent enzyme
MTAPSSPFVPYVRQKTVLLTTYRRDGTSVGTPVNIAVDGDRAFFRTYASAGKSKRLRHQPEVELAPSTVRGQPTGPAIRARTRLLSGEEAMLASREIEHKHPLLQRVLVPLAHRLRGYTTVHYELTPLQP